MTEISTASASTSQFLAYLALASLFFVATFLQLSRRFRKEVAKKCFDGSPSIYFRLHKFFFGKELEAVIFCVTIVQNILRLLFLLFALTAFCSTESHSHLLLTPSLTSPSFLFFLLLLVTGLFLCGDLLPRFWATFGQDTALQLSAPISSVFLLFFLPITVLFFRLLRALLPQSFTPFGELTVVSKEKLLETIREADDGNLLSDHDKKLVQSVLTFRDRIAREVMVPRVNLFTLPYDTTLEEATKKLDEEGYSRVPVYKNGIDEIVGVLMYKDLLLQIHSEKQDQERLVGDIVKPVIFAPETKKISQLLQEFRKKQTHMAIIVDEYGGTAGIVTIEDILEEIVGEIADEYDEERSLFRPSGKNAWIVDARMNLLDLKEELAIEIPEEGEYDTIAGYIFYRLGTIPPKGAHLTHDQFDIEILSSQERMVDKVKITLQQPRKTI